MSFLPKLLPRSDEDRQVAIERSLLRREAEIGGELFGPLSEDCCREFFCLDKHTWIWYEEWIDQTGHRQATTTRYDVRPNGVLKLQDGKVYQKLSVQEGRNLYQAVALYSERVSAYYKNKLQSA